MSSIPVPEDILILILLRLPSKSVALFRCVCKLWCTLLSDPRFVKTHCDLVVEKNCPINNILLSVGAKRIIYSLNLSASQIEKGVQIRYPFEDSKGLVYILGSSNGLLCIHGGNYYNEGPIFIWNPTTKEYKSVPMSPNDPFPSELPIRHKYKVSYGFGYDSKIKNYKLIKVMSSIRVPSRSGVHVYNLGSDSWNTHECIHYYFPCSTRCSGIIVHGCLHWFGKPGVESHSQDGPDVIVSFDISNERFVVLAIPAAVESQDVIKNQELGVFDGCLCLLHQEPGSRRFDLWVMREHGVRESWSILFTTNLVFLVDFPISNNIRVYATENGEYLWPNDDMFIIYNPRNDSVRTVKMPGCEWVEVESYVTSLFPLNSGTYVGQHDRIEDLP